VEADRILGIASTGHGASISYVDRTGTVRGSQLERWSGVKHMLLFSRDEAKALRTPETDIDRLVHYVFTEGFGRFPDSAVFEDVIEPWFEWLLEDLGVGAGDIDLVVTSDGHFATGWSRLGPELRRWFPNAVTANAIEHHEIHQRQAYWPSGLDEAAVLTLDTCGDELGRLGGRKLAGTIAMLKRDGESKVLREFFFPEMSAGWLYSAASQHVGFLQGDEGKTMGLAPYGTAELWDTLAHHLVLHDDGGFTFLGEAEFAEALTSYTAPREPGRDITQRHRDVAYAAQALIEGIVVNAWQAALALTGCRNLAYAGGVALNSVANELAVRAARPNRFYVAPNPGDPGHALGCAFFGAFELAGWEPPEIELPEYLGPPYPPEAIDSAVAGCGFPVERPTAISEVVGRVIANGHIVARFDGGAEFGPRALGNRSILCDPRRPGMKDFLNLRVKHREAFRPFAPAVLEDRASEWFEMDGPSSYMLRVLPVRSERRDLVPAITHVDGTARVQTVASDQNPGFWAIIEAFSRLTGIPMVLNTSLNLAGFPIVESPEDAVRCFAATDIDVLVIGPYLVSKDTLPGYLATDSGA
jgi:carbamoyltransferase